MARNLGVHARTANYTAIDHISYCSSHNTHLLFFLPLTGIFCNPAICCMKSFMLIFIVVQWFINNIIVLNIHSYSVRNNVRTPDNFRSITLGVRSSLNLSGNNVLSKFIMLALG